ncbi:MAG: hypothetical protein ACK569_09970, partial [Hyphomonadaceae bacterium]
LRGLLPPQRGTIVAPVSCSWASTSEGTRWQSEKEVSDPFWVFRINGASSLLLHTMKRTGLPPAGPA